MNKKSKLVMASAMTIFGTIGIFRRYIPLESSMVALVRGFIGTVVLLLYVLIAKKKLSGGKIRENFLKLIVSGALIGFNWIFLFEAYEYTTVATATLCYYMAPVIVMLIAPLLLKERLTGRKGICIALAFAGMVLVSGIFSEGIGGEGSYKGIIFGLIAALMYAVVIIINKKMSDIGSFDKTIMQLGTAAVVLFPYVWATGGFNNVSMDMLCVVMLLIVGVVHTGIAYALYFSSMGGLSANSVAILSYIDPVVAILLSTFLLKESMDFYKILGAVLILGATLWSELSGGKDK